MFGCLSLLIARFVDCLTGLLAKEKLQHLNITIDIWQQVNMDSDFTYLKQHLLSMLHFDENNENLVTGKSHEALQSILPTNEAVSSDIDKLKLPSPANG